MNTKEDISRRKQLTINVLKKYKDTYKSPYLSIAQKVRHFNIFAQSTMLYNSELWTMTETLNKSLDAFHRRLLRQCINITWPRKISNISLYDLTKATPWSSQIEKRRLSWLGHLMRLNSDTPARKALDEALVPQTRKRGKPKTIWLNTIKKDLEKRNIKIDLSNPIETIKTLTDTASDRHAYRTLISKLPGERAEWREPVAPPSSTCATPSDHVPNEARSS